MLGNFSQGLFSREQYNGPLPEGQAVAELRDAAASCVCSLETGQRNTGFPKDPWKITRLRPWWSLEKFLLRSWSRPLSLSWGHTSRSLLHYTVKSKSKHCRSLVTHVMVECKLLLTPPKTHLYCGKTGSATKDIKALLAVSALGSCLICWSWDTVSSG